MVKGVVVPVNIFHCSSLVAMQNLVATYHIVWVYVGGPKTSGLSVEVVLKT